MPLLHEAEMDAVQASDRDFRLTEQELLELRSEGMECHLDSLLHFRREAHPLREAFLTRHFLGIGQLDLAWLLWHSPSGKYAESMHNVWAWVLLSSPGLGLKKSCDFSLGLTIVISSLQWFKATFVAFFATDIMSTIFRIMGCLFGMFREMLWFAAVWGHQSSRTPADLTAIRWKMAKS